MDEYKKVDIKEYVDELLSQGVEPFEAEKFARIAARPGIVGEQVITWSVDENGNPIIERDSTVKLDENTNQPGWVVTKLDENNKPLLDKNGHDNTWIVPDSKFKQKYEMDNQEGIYKPTGNIQKFIEIKDNIILNGSEMKVATGGFINITDPNNMYGVSSRDFADTYRKVKNYRIEELTEEEIKEQENEVMAAYQPRVNYLQQVYNSTFNEFNRLNNVGLKDEESSLTYDPNWLNSEDEYVKMMANNAKHDIERIVDLYQELEKNSTSSYINDQGHRVFEYDPEEMVEQMAQGIDVLDENKQSNEVTSGKTMGFTVPWLIGLTTGIISVGLLMLGAFLTK